MRKSLKCAVCLHRKLLADVYSLIPTCTQTSNFKNFKRVAIRLLRDVTFKCDFLRIYFERNPKCSDFFVMFPRRHEKSSAYSAENKQKQLGACHHALNDFVCKYSVSRAIKKSGVNIDINTPKAPSA